MSAMDDARSFLEAVAGYAAEPAGGAVPSHDRPVRFGTVDALYSGSGPAKVLFDGESLMGLMEYVLGGGPIAANDRVWLLPAGRTYLIGGKVGGSSGGVPLGTVEWFSASTLPGAEWSLADGGTLVRADYALLNALYAADGYPHGNGNGTTTFNKPDMRGLAPVGVQAPISLGTVTFNSTTDIVTVPSGSVVDGDRVYVTGGTMPGGLTSGLRVFVINSTATTCQLALTPGGAAINFTSAGSGTRTMFSDNFALGYAGGEKAHRITVNESAKPYVNIRRFDGDANDYLAGSGSAYGIDATYTPGGIEHAIGMTQGGERPHNTMGPYRGLTPMVKVL